MTANALQHFWAQAALRLPQQQPGMPGQHMQLYCYALYGGGTDVFESSPWTPGVGQWWHAWHSKLPKHEAWWLTPPGHWLDKGWEWMDDDGYYARPYYYNELAKGAKGSAKGDAAKRKLRGTRCRHLQEGCS